MHNQLSFQELLLDTIPQLICWKDRNNTILGANRYYVNFFGADDAMELEDPDRPSAKKTMPRMPGGPTASTMKSCRLKPPCRASNAAWPMPPAMSGNLEVKKVPLRDKASRVVGTLTMSEGCHPGSQP